MRSAWFRLEPLTWTAREMLLMRAMFALVVMFAAIPWQLDATYAAVEAPNGLARVVPLAWMLAEPASLVLRGLTAVGLLFYVVGRGSVVALLPAVVACCGLGALRNSAGNISHHLQIAAMVLLAQWGVYVFAALRRRTLEAACWAVRATLIVIAASYVASGIVKLKASRLQWIANTPAMGVHTMKTNLAQHYSDGKPVREFETEVLPVWLGEHPNVTRLIFAPGLFLELGAVLLLFNKRLTRAYGLALIALHLGISLLLKIEFWNHMLVVGIFCVNVPGWIRSRSSEP
jgi:hypothetical protein